jgi:hypothetical protein
MSWTLISGVIVLLYAGYCLYKGRVGYGSGDDYSSTVTYVTRAEKPVRYWFLILLLVAVAVILIFNVFHF